MRIIRISIVTLFSAQIFTAGLLIIIAAIRDRNKKHRGFPRIDLKEVTLHQNQLQIYSYGSSLYQAMLEAIDNAQEYIYLETYIWKDDEAGWEFKSHLAKKAAEGVKVYIIFDRLGNFVVPYEFKVSFDPRIHVVEYTAIHAPLHFLDIRRYSLDHRKILVVDGQTSFIGGYNIGSAYKDSWRDTHLRIIGPTSTELARSFTDFWNRFCNPKDKIELHHSRRFDPYLNLHGNDALRLAFPIRDMYIEAINRAEQSILLSNAYFVPDRILLEALKAAAQRGVDVRILIPLISNHIIVDWISHGYFGECLDAGIRILGYSPAMLHAKTCTIDGQWSTIGTANMDRLSSIGNYELNIEIFSTEFAHQMERLFEHDTTYAKQLTSEAWHKRPWYTKLGEHILSSLRFMM